MFKVILLQMTNANMLQIMDGYFDRVRTVYPIKIRRPIKVFHFKIIWKE